MFTPRRLDQPELLDEHDAPRADVERSLRDLQRFNRYFGGRAIYRRLLRRVRDVQSVIDVGSGTADNLATSHANVRVAVDFKIEHLLYVKRDGILRVAGDAARLPFRSGAADAVTSAHFFHHFSPDENVAILNEALRVARKAVIVNDTRRHYVPLLVVRLLAVLHLVGRITRFDAPASVMRGYTVEETRAIGVRTQAASMSVRKLWPYRFGLILWK